MVRELHGGPGRNFWGELSRVRVLGQAQELLGYLHVVRDVTEQREVQRRLREQDQRSREALDSVPHVLWLSSDTGRLIYANQQFRDLLESADVGAQVHPGDREAYRLMWERAYRESLPQELDLRLALHTPSVLARSQDMDIPPPGWRWVSLKVAPLRGGRGEVREWIAVATDVHARLLAEQRAVAEQDHYRMVLNGMPQLVWTVDEEWNVSYVNGRWYALQPGLPTPTTLDELLLPLHPDDLAPFHAAVVRARQETRPLEMEVRMVGPDGHYRAYVLRAVPLLDAQGTVEEWVGTTTDVDDQVRAEASARLMVQISDALTSVVAGGAEIGADDRRYQQAIDLMASSLDAAVGLWQVDLVAGDGEMTPVPGELGLSSESTGWATLCCRRSVCRQKWTGACVR
ncbi:PAS domain-containing protein [Deinococcus radiophilus]|uniref:PAS domain-containing protein n=1 Tax=Deinococcus radiophilus TaxID=32062 RepID=UPI00360E09DE